MSLFPDEDVLTKEIESCKGFADGLSAEEDRRVFMKMLNDCYKYAKAINSRGQPFPAEPVKIQALSSDQETRVLNDLDEKFHSMAMLAMEDPSIARVIDTRDYANKRETAFSFHILRMCAHAYAMRQRRVLVDNEWAGWLQWMRNCFRRGTIGEIWKQIEPDGWFNPAFQNFINTEIVPTK